MTKIKDVCRLALSRSAVEQFFQAELADSYGVFSDMRVVEVAIGGTDVEFLTIDLVERQPEPEGKE